MVFDYSSDSSSSNGQYLHSVTRTVRTMTSFKRWVLVLASGARCFAATTRTFLYVPRNQVNRTGTNSSCRATSRP
jgi:hypothetical protein